MQSMTAFATQQGGAQQLSWLWELRSVNGRGLDIKLRLPDGFHRIEGHIRKAIPAQISRGNITVGLRVQRSAAEAEAPLEIDVARLDVILAALDQIQDRAFEKGVTLGQPTAADVLAQRGVLVPKGPDTAEALQDLPPEILRDFDTALAALATMRAAEGAELGAVLRGQIDQIAALTAQASDAAQARAQSAKENLQHAAARVIEATQTGLIEPERLTQELALIAVRTDITEEIDRLNAHVTAARDLLDQTGPIGRKLDFLSQEFNREANTMCAKAQDTALTQIGLALKALIDQMREQVQNLE